MKKNIKTYHGLVIYQTSGKAAEYSPWAANFFNGCSHNCAYCYNNHGITSGVLGGETVRLKKSLIDETTAYDIFCKELDKYREAIIADGALHFNFVSDPCLPQTIKLNWKCINYALSQKVPCQVLTKRADWLDHPEEVQKALMFKSLLRVGFSLTGCDELEPGANTNEERLLAMRELHNAGISTWASIEPIIDPKKSLAMIQQTIDCCDHYKIGVLSGKKAYGPWEIRKFIHEVNALNPRSVYWKQSLLEFATRNK